MIASVENQTYKGWHHILVNDNNPGVREVFKDVCDRTKRHWIDLGVRTHYYGALARNIGVMAAFSYVHASKRDIENEWIVFHDDDNRWTPDHLETMIEAIEENPDCSIVACDAEWRGVNNPEWSEIRPCVIRHGGCDLGQFMYKTRLFRDYGYLFPHPHRKQRYDWELIDKIVSSGERLVHTRKPTFIMYYRKQ
jgi:glycosyltransferase involved in cell wall biosynthesis